jgi:hypothetical protein
MNTEKRQADGTSFFDQPRHGWPRRRVIASCDASKGPLLTRYYLLDTKRAALYLHHLHTSDEDRALHDHPWSFVTLLLSGGYYEHTTTERLWRRRFSVLYRPAEWQHRLELVRPTWTLVLRLSRRREWGFITRAGWLDWRSYGRQWCD